MKHRARVRAVAGVAGIATLFLAATTMSAPTEAAWTDAEYANSQEITAIDVPEPVPSRDPGCVLSPGALGLYPTVTIYWRVPEGATGYALEDAEYGQQVGGVLEPLLGGLLGNVSTSGSPTAYTTVISSGLLTGLLGASKKIAIRFAGPGGWNSDWLVANASMGLGGINPVCTMSTEP